MTNTHKEFIEEGAALEHDRWARWQKWCHQVFVDGKFEEYIPRWERQIATPYSELSEEEKESDRKETRNYLPLIARVFSAGEKKGKDEITGGIARVITEVEKNNHPDDPKYWENLYCELRNAIVRIDTEL